MFGMVLETDDGFEIITDEKGLLLPCDALPEAFKKDGLLVTVSGQAGVPCTKTDQPFTVTPIDISSLTLRTQTYDKTDVTIAIIKSEDYSAQKGFGYFIEDKRKPNGTRIIQPHIPAVGGLKTFCSRDQAMKTAIAMVCVTRGGRYISIEEAFLKYIHVLKPC